MSMLLGVTWLILRGAPSGRVVGIWALTLLCAVALFRYHVTTPLELSF